MDFKEEILVKNKDNFFLNTRTFWIFTCLGFPLVYRILFSMFLERYRHDTAKRVYGK